MRLLVLFAFAITLMAAGGCGSSASGESAGYTKDDFKKTPPPAGYMGNVPKGPSGPPPGAGAPK